MPTYDYFCEANGRKVEVSHKMSVSIATWGELCEKSATPIGDTPAETPVRRLITGGAVISTIQAVETNRPVPPAAAAQAVCADCKEQPQSTAV